MIIGDTPQQLGQIEAADAMLIDGKIVTRDDYRALAAQVEVLRRELQACQNVLHSLAHVGQVTPAYANDAKKVLAATPQQHLAEIRAQAGRDGFVAGYSKGWNDFDGADGFRREPLANQYADSIRRGEVEL